MGEELGTQSCFLFLQPWIESQFRERREQPCHQLVVFFLTARLFFSSFLSFSSQRARKKKSKKEEGAWKEEGATVSFLTATTAIS